MFTGIIEEIGTISRVDAVPYGRRFCIQAKSIFDDLSVEDSISVNGVCLTVEKVEKFLFEVTAVDETLKKSTLSVAKNGDPVNLERAMEMGKRFGGHIVFGHVDGVGTIQSIGMKGVARLYEIEIPSDLEKYVVTKGSIAVDGISLTVAELNSCRIKLSVVPYTLENSTLKQKRTGDKVNVEVDVLGKYVEKILRLPEKSKMTEEWLRSKGFT